MSMIVNTQQFEALVKAEPRDDQGVAIPKAYWDNDVRDVIAGVHWINKRKHAMTVTFGPDMAKELIGAVVMLMLRSKPNSRKGDSQ